MNRMRRLLLLPALVLSGCVYVGFRPPQVAADRGAREQAVYAAVLDSLFPATPDSHWLVVDQTDQSLQEELVPEFWDAFGSLPGLHRSTLRDFRAVNEMSRLLSAPIDAAVVVGLASQAALDSLPRGYSVPPPGSSGGDPGDYWRAFRDRYPKALGVITVSQVGFRADGRQAVLTVKHACGSLCGGGMIVLLEWLHGRWDVVHVEELWEA